MLVRVVMGGKRLVMGCNGGRNDGGRRLVMGCDGGSCNRKKI